MTSTADSPYPRLECVTGTNSPECVTTQPRYHGLHALSPLHSTPSNTLGVNLHFLVSLRTFYSFSSNFFIPISFSGAVTPFLYTYVLTLFNYFASWFITMEMHVRSSFFSYPSIVRPCLLIPRARFLHTFSIVRRKLIRERAEHMRLIVH